MIWHRSPLPVRVDILRRDETIGVTIRHNVRIGYAGLESVLDPALARGHGRNFAIALDEHVR